MAQGFATWSFGEIWFLSSSGEFTRLHQLQAWRKEGWGLAVAPSCGGMLSTCSLVGADITRQRCSGTTQRDTVGWAPGSVAGCPLSLHWWPLLLGNGSTSRLGPTQTTTTSEPCAPRLGQKSQTFTLPSFCLPTSNQNPRRCPLPGTENRLPQLLQRRGRINSYRLRSLLLLEALFIQFTLAKTRHSIPPAGRLCRLVTHGRLQRSCL
ncbi:hypothetical protein HDV62DRAFT_298340 [Trichoderma sp. SZMC 28011]